MKVSVSLDAEDLAWLKRQARRRKSSLSAVLTESVRRTRRARALDELLAELGAPKPTVAQLKEYRRLWRLD